MYHRGEKVIDVYGLSEPNAAADYDEDTLQIVYSSSKAGLPADIFSLKHESSIFRSVIQPCMWFLHDGTG